MTMFKNTASGTALWALALAVTLAVPGLAGATELTCITNCSSVQNDADDGYVFRLRTGAVNTVSNYFVSAPSKIRLSVRELSRQKTDECTNFGGVNFRNVVPVLLTIRL